MLRTFEQFVKERRYITNVSETTVRWYWCSWKAWKKYQPDFIINARQAGVSAATLNCYLRALNAYFRWAGLPILPKPFPILNSFSAEAVISPKFTSVICFVCLMVYLNYGSSNETVKLAESQ